MTWKRRVRRREMAKRRRGEAYFRAAHLTERTYV